MRNIAACYSQHAIKVSESYRSGPSDQSHVSPIPIPSIQDEVSCTYRARLSTGKHLLIKLSWCNLNSISICDDPSSPSKFSSNSCYLRGARGAKSFESCSSNINVYWNLSAAKYGDGPEPITGFYLIIFADSELILRLGDGGGDADGDLDLKKMIAGVPVAKFSLVSRSEHFSGGGFYSTRARFCETGLCHEILIKCIEEKGSKSWALSVSVDHRNAIRVKRLEWNFRGNQTIFVDGILVDVMWDVHDWFFNQTSGCAVFMFRRRNGLESRIWLEERIWDHQKEENESVGFSLLIFACKGEGEKAHQMRGKTWWWWWWRYMSLLLLRVAAIPTGPKLEISHFG
ncbi:uncharacterized protein LOC127789780 [Diospyros lotus]|uniref:uncharacterized protein LOC127789780 n=1 Tax=Diospyros lotus TaxID=55363 RepID=UPI00224EF0ED|nr:uncharacterized protein LOC127789780 [Diospyros lotus]